MRLASGSAYIALFVLSSLCGGCASPYRADQGALIGGVTGAGVGALVGEAVGNPLAGAVIGAGVGTMSGALIGDSLDEIEARNQAEIEARLGRRLGPGGVAVPDVVAMSRAGVSDEVIINHIRIHGTATALQTNDLIYLQQNGVSPAVVQVMQNPPAPAAVVHHVPPPPGRVVIHEPYYPPPHWHRPPPRIGFHWHISR